MVCVYVCVFVCVCVCVCVCKKGNITFYKVAFILRNKIFTHTYDKQQLTAGHLHQTKTQIVVKDVEENEKKR
jgi:hypothetical protein